MNGEFCGKCGRPFTWWKDPPKDSEDLCATCAAEHIAWLKEELHRQIATVDEQAKRLVKKRKKRGF